MHSLSGCVCECVLPATACIFIVSVLSLLCQSFQGGFTLSTPAAMGARPYCKLISLTFVFVFMYMCM